MAKKKVVAKEETGKRPILVSILCILGFIGVFFGVMSSVFLYFAESTEFSYLLGELLPTWYSTLSFALIIFNLVAFILLWQMKKIG